MARPLQLVVSRSLGAALVVALVTGLVARLPARPGEPWLVRWLRVVVDHPLRSTVALTLVGLALTARPGAPAPRRPEALRSDRVKGHSMGRAGASDSLRWSQAPPQGRVSPASDGGPHPPVPQAARASPPSGQPVQGSRGALEARIHHPALGQPLMFAQLQEDVVHGPTEHPRFGRSFLVRPTVEATRANRFPSQAVVITSVARRLIELSKEGEKIHAIVVEGGDKDPTSHPEFHEISENLRELVNKWYPKAKLCLLSDVPDLERPQARHALNFYDLPILRLDAGTQKTFAALTGEKAQVFKGMVEHLARIESERLVLETCFVRGDIDNSKDSEVKAWLRHVSDIKPAKLHLCTPDKAKDKSLRPITKTRMNEIAELVTQKTGITVEVSGI